MTQPVGPQILAGDAHTAYRDPAAVIADGICHLYFTYVLDVPGGPWMHVGECVSRDLSAWSDVRLLTPRDKRLNYSSPGNIVRDGDEWVMCLQTYCRENGEKYGSGHSRVYAMRSRDLVTWSEPELLRVKGEDVPFDQMGRMIDPYLLRAQNSWWCFFKQNGVSFSRSDDLRAWTFIGRSEAGENVCVLPYRNGWRMFSSPENGIHVMDSSDLITWNRAMDDLTLWQASWPWAKGRLTAAFVLRNGGALAGYPEYIMFFHGSRYPESIAFDSDASIGVAFSDDLENWVWHRKDC